jgi:hypothetical protein
MNSLNAATYSASAVLSSAGLMPEACSEKFEAKESGNRGFSFNKGFSNSPAAKANSTDAAAALNHQLDLEPEDALPVDNPSIRDRIPGQGSRAGRISLGKCAN